MDENVSGSGDIAGSPSAPAAAPATPSAPVSSPITSQSQAPAIGAVPEDRSNWIPPQAFKYRLQETRDAAAREVAAQYAEREAQVRAEADRYKQQLQALVGFTQPQNPEIDAVRQQFSQLFPQLARLEERGEDVLGLLERAGDLDAVQQHHWQEHGVNTMNRLYEKAQTVFGAPLSEDGRRQLHSYFVGYVQQSPEMVARYVNDPSVVEEFLRMFTSNFVDPVRRSASATVVGRIPGALPQDTYGGTPPVSSGPKPANLDERAAQGFALYNQIKRQQ